MEGTIASTIYIRSAGLHSRGELLNDFFYTHRAALGLEEYYTASGNPSTGGGDNEEAESATATTRTLAEGAASPRLPAGFPVEVVYVKQSRKPYFLVEWRYPTKEETEKQKASEDDSTGQAVEDSAAKKTELPTVESSASSSGSHLSGDVLAQLTERTLALGKSGGTEDNLVWRDQPVTISTALAGMTVAAERSKLELRDAQLKTQRIAEKRAREEAEAVKDGKSKQGDANKPASSFVPRSVRRRV